VDNIDKMIDDLLEKQTPFDADPPSGKNPNDTGKLPDPKKSNPNYVGFEELMAYESGEMDTEQVADMFSRLIKSGLIHQLQGSYGRTASQLLDAGILDRQGNVDYDAIADLD